MDVTNDPNRTFHRGKEVKTALYEMHTDILRNKQSKMEEKLIMETERMNSVSKLKESEQMRINAFKKEFRVKLQEINQRSFED